jgi:hypothetical protein
MTTKDRRNVSVIKQINNQAPALRLAHERRRAHMLFKGTSTKSEGNFWSL